MIRIQDSAFAVVIAYCITFSVPQAVFFHMQAANGTRKEYIDTRRRRRRKMHQIGERINNKETIEGNRKEP